MGRWSGRVRAGAEEEHERFIDRLQTPESSTLLRKCSLTEYAVYQHGSELDVVFKSDRPVIIAGFLRNKKLWPAFWEFAHPGEVDQPTDKELIFHWSRG